MRQLNAHGAMTALLKDALQPNLVQTMENNPALMHGGPFANIAHGCNSVMATRTALKLSDYVVTEAGFGADLGAEKFFNIKCRKAGLRPDAVVLVATIKALKMHGGVPKDELGKENTEALAAGCKNLGRHIRNLGKFGVPAVVAINRYTADTDAEAAVVKDFCKEFGVSAIDCTHWADGGKGTTELAEHVARLCDSGAAQFRTLYNDDLSLWEKARSGREGTVRRRRHHRRQEGARRICQLRCRPGTATIPFAWRRRSTAFRRTPTCWARRPATSCRFAKFASPPARNSWSLSAARS